MMKMIQKVFGLTEVFVIVNKDEGDENYDGEHSDDVIWQRQVCILAHESNSYCLVAMKSK